MLESCDIVAFAATTDLARGRAFYEETLGLRLVEQDDFACVFDANGTILRVTRTAQVAQPGYTVLGWLVDDVQAAVSELVGRGVAFERFDGLGQDDDGIWTAPGGSRVAWFKDPDGNTLSLTQHA
jgi:catechol 2,3-dioxygenase-like lactoylglutathione lyase family enzyme